MTRSRRLAPATERFKTFLEQLRNSDPVAFQIAFALASDAVSGFGDRGVGFALLSSASAAVQERAVRMGKRIVARWDRWTEAEKRNPPSRSRKYTPRRSR